MNKEMDNRSFNERNSLPGNSGLLGLTKTKLLPMRIQVLQDLCNSDDEDSEDKGDSESEDAQLLTDDDEEEEEARQPKSLVEEPLNTPANSSEESKAKASCVSEMYVSSVKETVATSSLEKFGRIALQRENLQASESFRNSEAKRFTDNFTSDEQSHRKIYIPKVASAGNSSESVSTISQVSLASKQAGSNRRSNVKFEMPEPAYCNENTEYVAAPVKSEGITHPFEAQEPNDKTRYTAVPVKLETLAYQSATHGVRPSSAKFEAPEPNEKASYPSMLAKSESMIYSSKVHGSRPSSSKFEATEGTYYSNERHLHSANVAQSELSSSGASSLLVSTSGHSITDTPLKNNPPLGSSRPTPSVSHRSMFQTPQSSKLRQDYTKNHVQTPATILSNWSQNRIIQTPLQSRSTPGDSGCSQAPSILAQHGHDTPWHRNNEDKDRPRRKPLGETIQTNNHSSEKSSAIYNMESSTSSKSHEFDDNNQNRGLAESIKDASSKKPTILGTHESKENRYPQPIEKSIAKEEPSRSRPPESIKDSIHVCSNGPTNEVRSEARSKVGSIQTSESQAPQSFRSSYSSRPNPTAGVVEEKKNVTERKANVQLSVPSSIPRSNHGETITVKGKDYLILGKLGEGMSGQVLRVQDLRSRDLRAIKLVNLNHMDKDCAQGCLQEISMLHKLQAPCVVKMFDYEISYPMVHVVMEMGDTDFRSLLHSMSEKKKLPLTMILYYWTEMLTAVKHIHDNGVIHSDLKPANFLLVRGRLKLIDFGIASSMNPDMTSVVKSSPIGTINYISPEALMDIGNGGDSPNKVKYKITFKSDVWSLGCILYSLVYGHTPFQHIRLGWAKMHAITNPNPNISFALPSGSDAEPPPPVLIDVMRKCLQHDPKARPTVGQLLQIPYVPTKQNTTAPSADISPNMLLKIKHALTDSEWRQFIDIMEAKRN